MATCYLLGVSTRRMDKLVEQLGITRLSKSQVSVMAKELDERTTTQTSRWRSQRRWRPVCVTALSNLDPSDKVVSALHRQVTDVHLAGLATSADRPRELAATDDS